MARTTSGWNTEAGVHEGEPPQIVGEEEVFKESSALCQLFQHFSPKSTSCRCGAWSALSQYPDSGKDTWPITSNKISKIKAV
jgi:hypothetical protein